MLNNSSYMIPEYIKQRKGARSLTALDPEVIIYLNKGLVETKNLMEWLATDQLYLLKLVLKTINKEFWYSDFEIAIKSQKKITANSSAKIIGQTFGNLIQDTSVYDMLKSHTSDVVRCWGCWAECMYYDTISDLITIMKPYAADPHFGVREVVIFCCKSNLIKELDTSIDILSRWTTDSNQNIRRFVAESMRPIGVWTKHITVFKSNSEKGLPLIEPLRSDPSKYVQDAVANWLNDASKTQPNWVKTICDRWQKESSTKETAYIVKRGLRTINKT